MIPWLIFIPFFNLVDYIVTHKGGKPNYKRYNITKAVFGVGCFFLVANFDSWQRFLISGLVMAIFELTSFWLIYPEIRNIWAKKPFLYYDTVELDSGGVDFFFAYHKKLYIPAKIMALVLFVLSGIVIYYL